MLGELGVAFGDVVELATEVVVPVVAVEGEATLEENGTLGVCTKGARKRENERMKGVGVSIKVYLHILCAQF